MTIRIYISAAIISAIITVVGNIISAKIAQRTALKTAQEATNQEIKKLEKTWEREDIVSSDEDFAEMVKAVAKVCDYYCLDNQQDAISKVASIRSKERGRLGDTLDDLYQAVKAEDFDAANMYLTFAIDYKRYPQLSRSEDSKV